VLAIVALAAMPGSLALAAQGDEAWDPGAVQHIIPTASDNRFLIKISLAGPQADAPQLRVADRLITGVAGGSSGRFWRFDVVGLHPDTAYRLRLLDGRGKPITSGWTLRTLPSAEAEPESLRILAYTCAGGDETGRMTSGVPFFLGMNARRALLERGLSFHPDAVIANGDHIYWDQRTSQNKPEPIAAGAREVFGRVGSLDRSAPPLGSRNEDVLVRVGEAQVSRLYGTRLRGIPSFFLTDDHDLFENDEADEELVTLPPDYWMLEMGRAVQLLFYPEFLPDPERPLFMPGSNSADRPPGVSEAFGTLRYGRLLEVLLYDFKRYASLGGPAARSVPELAENWIVDRTNADETAWLIHAPGSPFGWTAGKYGEPYPDVLDDEGTASVERAKYGWPSGWWNQHQRILRALGAQKNRVPILVEGDLHAIGYERILASGDLDFRANPIFAVLSGPLGTGAPGFPSAFRKGRAIPPTELVVDEALPPQEKNGFTIIDVTPDEVTFRFFAWRPPQPVAEIDALEPFHTLSIPRKRHRNQGGHDMRIDRPGPAWSMSKGRHAVELPESS
jgi:hypothetical protein